MNTPKTCPKTQYLVQRWKSKVQEYLQRDSEIRVECEEGVYNSWEKLGESECFCCKCRKGSMRDNAVWVITKNVFPCRGKNGGAMKASREVGSEKRPDRKRATEIGAV